MTYLIHFKQNGVGCDYTISCGETIKIIEAPSIDEAIIETGEIIDEYGVTMESVTIYTISDIHSYDVVKHMMDRVAKEREYEKKKSEIRERELYEILKQKFEINN